MPRSDPQVLQARLPEPEADAPGGFGEPAEGGFNQIKVTSKVQTPWFGREVGMNVAWRFLLDENDKIYFVAIDLLASLELPMEDNQ